jgi:hypothetical protein
MFRVPTNITATARVAINVEVRDYPRIAARNSCFRACNLSEMDIKRTSAAPLMFSFKRLLMDKIAPPT